MVCLMLLDVAMLPRSCILSLMNVTPDLGAYVPFKFHRHEFRVAALSRRFGWISSSVIIF